LHPFKNTVFKEYWKNFWRQTATGKEQKCYSQRLRKHAAPTKSTRLADWSILVPKRTWPLCMKWYVC